ncbi:MAG: helix-turn-helix domain-containing protein [Flavobacteriia bacterium]|nr:helix-turn-helix domain-containing protein [Flavobacteriia bacterium]
MDKLLILNRIKECKNLSSDKELAEFLGITSQNLSNWKSRNTIDYDLIFTKCEGIDTNWLISGKIFDSNRSDININSLPNIVAEPTAKYYKSPINQGIPMIPFEAFGGFGDTTIEGVNIETIQERYVIPLFQGIKIDFMIQVRGSSMYPKYNSGDVVACRIINELMFIQWNKVYVIDTISQGTLIKRLKKSNDVNNVICKSDNKDYDEFEIPKSDIRTIAMVVGVIRIE